MAGHLGDGDAARRGWSDADPTVRAVALGAMRRTGALDQATLVAALGDPSPQVRRRACEEVAAVPSALGAAPRVVDGVAGLASDPDPAVVEAACFALGELGRRADGAVEVLAGVAGCHPDPLCREAAVAALGAMGDERGLGAILRAATDRPAVRRRAVLALAPFEGPEVEATLARALTDRDWQVRQAAEDLGAQPG